MSDDTTKGEQAKSEAETGTTQSAPSHDAETKDFMLSQLAKATSKFDSTNAPAAPKNTVSSTIDLSKLSLAQSKSSETSAASLLDTPDNEQPSVSHLSLSNVEPFFTKDQYTLREMPKLDDRVVEARKQAVSEFAFPGGIDNDELVYQAGLSDPSLSIEEQIKAHMDFSEQLSGLADSPAYARYFGSLAQSALARNPHYSPEKKIKIMTELVDGLTGAIEEVEAASKQAQS